MDSCHLFNFLFGTKKATSELSRCFSSVSETAKKRSRDGRKATETSNNTSKNGCGSSSSCKSNEDVNNNNSQIKQVPLAPVSPLKQLQMKFTNFASGGNSSSKRSCSPTCDARCGTYRATLVHSTDLEEDSPLTDEEISLSITEDSLLKEPETANQLFLDKQNAEVSKQNLFKSSLTITNRQRQLGGAYEADKSTVVEAEKNLDQTLETQDLKDLNNNHVLSNSINNDNGHCRQPSKVPKYKRFVLYDDAYDAFYDNHQMVKPTDEVHSLVSSIDDVKAQLKVEDLSSCKEERTTSGLRNDEIGEGDRDTVKILDGDCRSLQDKRNVYVRSLVQSIETNGSFDNESAPVLKTIAKSSKEFSSPVHNSDRCVPGYTRPVTVVKPMPPKTPPKTNKAKCLNMQLIMNKPTKIQQLFLDEKFLIRFFDKLEPLERCTAAQVCRAWRNILYANQSYWKDLINVIDCIQLRREHLVECILNTLQTAKQRQHRSADNSSDNPPLHRLLKVAHSNPRLDQQLDLTTCGSHPNKHFDYDFNSAYESRKRFSGESFVLDIDQDDVWRIQELCNRFAHRATNQSSVQRQTLEGTNNITNLQQQQPISEQQICTTSKSSSIPSQISSTLSSVSLSSLLSPLSEGSRVESIKERLYNSLDNRGFDAICLYGATDDDVEELICKLPPSAHKRIIVGRLNNCCVSNRGLELFLAAFRQIQELELSGCNELTNSLELKETDDLKRLIITDCINIADGVAQKLVHLMHQLDELTIQAYHLTDAFFDYLCLNSDTTRLSRLELPNCKEITNQSLVTIAKYFPKLEALSISGSTKISDDGLDILAENARNLRILDLSWCSRITDGALERIACDLGDTLTDLILDRNTHITDTGLGYLATMSSLTLLHIRWCPRITDIGLESVIDVKSLRYLSLAGIHQITARSLLCLIESDLLEVELTNCPAVNTDLLMFLQSKMPNCNIIF